MTAPDLYTRLLTEIQQIPVIDTHEHIPNEATLDRSQGFFHFFDHYVSSDLVSAGMSKEALEALRDPGNGLTLEAHWKLMAPYWPYARTTGYGRAMLEYMRDLYGVPDINAETYALLCERITESHAAGDWYARVLEKANIEASLIITWPGMAVTMDRPQFKAVPILDHFANVYTRADLEALEAECGCAIQTLDQLLAALEGRLNTFIDEGIVAVKNFQAYRRTLRFDKADKSTAARCFDRVWLAQAGDLTFNDMKPLEDYVERYILGLAGEAGLPVQIHTGLQEGNGNILENSRPTHLNNLFMEFADVRFDVFHAGYPYIGEVAAMAKYFPNVYCDLCWMHAISPHVTRDTLAHWLEVVPMNKILGFGGDSNYIEGAYGHLQVGRRVTAEVLARKVAEDYFTEDEALWAAQRILRENAKALFAI